VRITAIGREVTIGSSRLICECGSGGRRSARKSGLSVRRPRQRPAGRANAKEVRAMDERSSWMRVAITIAIYWRFLVALAILVLALLLR
jgi:hypothetical protein